MKILIIGARGMVGSRCAKAWPDAEVYDERIETLEDARKAIALHKPDAVLNAAGIKGRPNVDWCESHPIETINGNTLLPIFVAEACHEAGAYLLHVGSGCIFYGDSPHPDKAWRENDFGNPDVMYSRSKWATDLVLSTIPNVGIARIRMPIDHLLEGGNLITKLASYPKVIDVVNSATVVDDMVQVFRALLEKKAPGIFHVTNPGPIKHREIMAMYEELVDPTHTNEWIPNDELVGQGLAVKGRSNNFLASTRLAEFGITMRPIHEAVRDTMQKYAAAKKATGV